MHSTTHRDVAHMQRVDLRCRDVRLSTATSHMGGILARSRAAAACESLAKERENTPPNRLLSITTQTRGQRSIHGHACDPPHYLLRRLRKARPGAGWDDRGLRFHHNWGLRAKSSRWRQRHWCGLLSDGGGRRLGRSRLRLSGRGWRRHRLDDDLLCLLHGNDGAWRQHRGLCCFHLDGARVILRLEGAPSPQDGNGRGDQPVRKAGRTPCRSLNRNTDRNFWLH